MVNQYLQQLIANEMIVCCDFSTPVVQRRSLVLDIEDRRVSSKG